MRTIQMSLITIFYITLISTTIAGDAIPMEKGKWEVTTTMKMPMFREPRVEINTECVDKSQFSAKDLMPKDDSECTVTKSTVNGNTLTWEVECVMQNGKAIGGGSFTSNGDQGSGQMHMNIDVQGQSYSTEMTWQGRRLGPC